MLSVANHHPAAVSPLDVVCQLEMAPAVHSCWKTNTGKNASKSKLNSAIVESRSRCTLRNTSSNSGRPASCTKPAAKNSLTARRKIASSRRGWKHGDSGEKKAICRPKLLVKERPSQSGLALRYVVGRYLACALARICHSCSTSEEPGRSASLADMLNRVRAKSSLELSYEKQPK